MIRNIIFDWSGTLVDDLPAVLEASNHVFRRAGVPELDVDQFRSEFFLPFKAFYDRHVPHVPLGDLEEWFHGCFRTLGHLVGEIPHAREFLEWCREHGLRTFVLSSAHRNHYARQEKETGFGAYIERAYVEVHDKRTKIVELLVEHGLAPDETMFIGDMQHDIETAHLGGVYACAVLTGYNNALQLRASRPDLIVEHLGELARVLGARGFRLDADEQSLGTGESPQVLFSHPVPTVGGLVFNGAGDVLMIRTRKWSDRWGIPGGKIKTGEPCVDALRRELKEETGLEVDQIEFVMVQDCINPAEFYRDAHFLLLNYTCHCAGAPAVRLNEEGQQFRWVKPEAAIGMNLNQPTRVLLNEVLGRAAAGRAHPNRGAA